MTKHVDALLVTSFAASSEQSHLLPDPFFIASALCAASVNAV